MASETRLWAMKCAPNHGPENPSYIGDVCQRTVGSSRAGKDHRGQSVLKILAALASDSSPYTAHSADFRVVTLNLKSMMQSDSDTTLAQ